MPFPVLFTLTICFLYGIIVHQWNAKQANALPFSWVAFAFLLRIGFTVVYGFLFLRFYNGDDTWMLHREIEEEFGQLVNDPQLFFLEPFYFKELFAHDTLGTGFHYYLMDWENWIICKPLALLQPLTGGNYYCQAILFNLLPFWGNMLLYRYFITAYPDRRKTVYFILFLFPPLVFWWSGLRSDGLLLFFSALLMAGASILFRDKRTRGWNYLLAGAAGVMILRIQLLLLWFPALLAYMLHYKARFSHAKAIIVVYGSAVVLYFGSALLSPNMDMTRWVAEKQQLFKKLPGKTRFDLRDLEPGISGFIKTFPQAMENIFLRPYLWEARGMLQWLAAADVCMLWILTAVFFFSGSFYYKGSLASPELLYPLFFALSLYVFIGYTIPFPGAIVRYKVQAEFILLLFLTLNLRKIKNIN
jgi:hypothetical protein